MGMHLGYKRLKESKKLKQKNILYFMIE